MNNNYPLLSCKKDDKFFTEHDINDLAIPTGLYFMSNHNNNTSYNKSINNTDDIKIIDDTLFNKLLELQTYLDKDNKNNKSRKYLKKRIKTSNNKSRKNKA